MAKPVEKKCRTTNWSAYNKALKSRGSLSIWLDKEMAWFAGGSGKGGRSATYSEAAIQFCLSLKCLCALQMICATKPCGSVDAFYTRSNFFLLSR